MFGINMYAWDQWWPVLRTGFPRAAQLSLGFCPNQKVLSVYRAQSDEASKSPLTSDDQWSQPESKNGSRIYQCHKKMTQRTRLAKSEPIQKQRTVTVVCIPTFTPISIVLTDSKRALEPGKIAQHVKVKPDGLNSISRSCTWGENQILYPHPQIKNTIKWFLKLLWY